MTALLAAPSPTAVGGSGPVDAQPVGIAILAALLVLVGAIAIAVERRRR